VVRPVRAEVHSDQTYGIGYNPHRMFDGDWGTAWSIKGNGTGAELHFDFAEPQWLTDVWIWPGYHRSDALWKQNSAPTKVSVITDDRPPQSFDLPKEQNPPKEPRMKLAARIQVKKLTLRIDAVRKGTRYADTLIAQLRFSDGDQPFVPDPTPAYEASSAALKKQLAPARLDGMVDQLYISPDEDWHVGFFGDGRLYLRRFTNYGGDYYEANTTFEVQEVGAATATFKIYGALTHVPVTKGHAAWDESDEHTINGKLVVEPTPKGIHLTLSGQPTKYVTLPQKDLEPARPYVSPKQRKAQDAGFQILFGYTFRAPVGDLKLELHTAHVRMQGNLGDPAVSYFAHMNVKVKESSSGRIVLSVEGNTERNPKKGPRTHRDTKGELLIEPAKEGTSLQITPSGGFLEMIPLPKGTYTLDW